MGDGEDSDRLSPWLTEITSLFPFKIFYGWAQSSEMAWGDSWVHRLPRLLAFWLKETPCYQHFRELIIEQWASGPLALRSGHTMGGRTLATSGSRGFPERSRCHDTVQGRLWGTCCSWLAGPEKGAWGDVLAAAETICFEDPPCFSLARHRLPNYTFLGGMETCIWDELTSSKTT